MEFPRKLIDSGGMQFADSASCGHLEAAGSLKRVLEQLAVPILRRQTQSLEPVGQAEPRRLSMLLDPAVLARHDHVAQALFVEDTHEAA